MMKKIRLLLLGAGLLLTFSAAPVYAQDPPKKGSGDLWGVCGEDAAENSEICNDTTEATGIVKRIVDILLFAIGTLSVIMIVHSGLKYTTSQ